MNLKPIILALAASAAPIAVGQINSPQGIGFADRAAAMLGQGNYQGCLDQCEIALKMGNVNREQVMWLSTVASFKGGMADAETKLKNFIAQFPTSAHIPSARLMAVTVTFHSGDYPGALSELEAINGALLSKAEEEDLTYRKAFCLIKTGRNPEALVLLNKLEGGKRYKAAATFYKGYIAYDENRFEEALELFGQCDKTSAPGDMADYYTAQILFRQSKFADAANILMPLLARKDMAEEYTEEVQRLMGECLYAMGDDNGALAYLNPYVAKHPDTAPLSTRYIVGTERYQMGLYDEAITLLAPVTELNDGMGQSATLTLGQSYMSTGNSRLAMMAFEKAAHLDLDPKITELAYYNYAAAQVDGGRVPFGSSVKTLEEFLTRYPDSRYANTVRDYLVKGYMATDDYTGALRALNAIKGKPGAAVLDARQRVNFVLGSRALQKGEAKEALGYLQEARRYADRNEDIARQTNLWLGDAYYALGDFGKAEKEYQTFLKTAPGSDPNRGVAQYNLGYALFGQRKYDEARMQFKSVSASRQRALDLRVDCINRIADTYYYESDFGNAEKTYAEAYALNPATGDYSLYQLALMQGHNGNMERKLSSLEKFIDEFPSSSLRADALMEKALTLISLNRHGEAEATYKTVVSSYPATAQGRSALLQLALINNNAHRTKEAIEYYKEIVTKFPSSAEASMAVHDLTRIFGDGGNIEELDAFLAGIEGAPEIDAMERNAIAAANLLRTAKNDADDSTRLKAALELLQNYPDADGAEDALKIAADIEFARGMSDKALEHYTLLASRASTSAMTHSARMGMLRSARDLGDNEVILKTAAEILGSTAGSGADMNEVKFINACALAESGDEASAIALWSELAKTPASIYGTRAAFELADYHLQHGNLTTAADIANELIDANPPHAYWYARTYILYSDILRAQGPEHEFEADEYLRTLRANYPGKENDIFMMIDNRLPQK